MTRLNGAYGMPGAVHALHHNAPKAAFRKDALAYLRALQAELGWESGTPKRRAVRFNPAGPGTSGDATLVAFPSEHDVGVYVTIGASGMMPASSPSGASILWRLCTRQRPFGGDDPNQWPRWNTPTHELAQVIRARHASALTPAPLASCPVRIGGGFNLTLLPGARAVQVRHGHATALEASHGALLTALRTGATVLVHDQHAVTILSHDETTRVRTDALRTHHPLVLRQRLAVLLSEGPTTTTEPALLRTA